MRIILIIIAIVCSGVINASIINRNAKAINIDYGNGYGKQEAVDIDISFDTKSGMVVIYSKVTQIIDLYTHSQQYSNGWDVTTFEARDRDGASLKIQLCLSDYKEDVIQLIYSNVSYYYVLKEN